MAADKNNINKNKIKIIEKVGKYIVDSGKSTKTSIKKEFGLGQKAVNKLFDQFIELKIIERSKGGAYQPLIESEEELKSIIIELLESETPVEGEKQEQQELEHDDDERNSNTDGDIGKRKTSSGKFFKLVMGIVVIAAIGYFIYMYLIQPPQAYITFVFNSILAENEPGKYKVYISDNDKILGQFVGTSNEEGYIDYIYRDGFVGDTIFIKYKKNDFISQSDFSVVIEEPVATITKKIQFKKDVPPPPPDPTYTANLNFKNSSGGVAYIHLDGDTIATLSHNGTYRFNRSYKASESARLSFLATDDSIELKTNPPYPIYTVNKSINGNIEIFSELDKVPFVRYQILESSSKMPLEGIEIKFSDGRTPIVSDEKGIVEYQIKEKILGKSIGSRFNQTFAHPIETIPNIFLNESLPDTIADTLYCQVDLTIQIVVLDVNNSKLEDANVLMDKTKKLTDTNGSADFQVKTMGDIYNFKIYKNRYRSVEISVKPVSFITSDTVKLAGTYGTVILVDSLQENVTIPYVNIVEDGVIVGQTSQDGAAKINVLIAHSMPLEFKPSQSSIYKSKKADLHFVVPNDIKKVKLSPQPYVYTIHVVDDNGKNLENVKILHEGVTYKTDKNGIVVIEKYVVAPNPEESFSASHYQFRDEKRISTDKNIREYTINFIKASKIPVTIRSNPKGATITITNVAGDVVANGAAPLQTDLEYGMYTIKAVNKKNQTAESIYEINGPVVKPIVLDLINPVVQIIDNYGKQEYAKVVALYDRNLKRVNYLLNNDEQYSSRKCEVLQYVAKSYNEIDQSENSITIWKTLATDCAKSSPIFYREYANILFNNGYWKEADENYQRSLMHIGQIDYNQRSKFYSDCLLARIQAKYKYFDTNRSNLDLDKCKYLDEIKRLILEVKQVVNKNKLNNFPIDIVIHIENNIAQYLRDNC